MCLLPGDPQKEPRVPFQKKKKRGDGKHSGKVKQILASFPFLPLSLPHSLFTQPSRNVEVCEEYEGEVKPKCAAGPYLNAATSLRTASLHENEK